MKKQGIIVSVGLLVLLSVLMIGLSQAQEPRAQESAAPQAVLGTAFSYQGQLESGNYPVNGDCDFQFGLYDALSGGVQVGITQTVGPVVVTNGLFVVSIDFGPAFNGDARWLQLAVRCPAGSGSYTSLAPRQELAPAPYALALPGLYTQQTDGSPNLIGGYNGNSVMAGVYGSTIAGGGESSYPNTVTDMFCTIGGGSRNEAGNGNGVITDTAYSTVGGGYNNHARNIGSTISGGSDNWAAGSYSTVSGGQLNSASAGNHATVAGGMLNLAGGGASTVSGGFTNAATNGGATIGGGENNIADGYRSTIGGGAWSTASGWGSTIGGGERHSTRGMQSTVAGGYHNIASGDYATVPGGGGAAASLYGQMSYASGTFIVPGDAQTSIYVLRRTTTSATPVELLLDGSSQLLTLDISRTLTFDILVVARSDAGASAGYQIRGVVENYAGTTGFIGTPTVTTLGEDVAAWDVSVAADDANDMLVIQVTGAAGTIIRWVATVRTAEVAW